MISIFEDQSLFDFVRHSASNGRPLSHSFKVHVFDWTQTPTGGCHLTSRNVKVLELTQLPVPVLRIIFSPLDIPGHVCSESLLQLFRHYDVPSAFLAGRLRSVTHSFGTLNSINGYNCSYFHYLCKNITVSHDAGGKPKVAQPMPGAPLLDQGDSSWIRSGYFLRWAVDSNRDPEVTLICFGASVHVKERLQQIAPSLILTSVVRDPFGLFAIVMDDLSLQMENTVWNLLEVFRQIELSTLTAMNDRESFTGLHNVSKHILFLQESAEATMLTLKSLSSHHQRLLETASGPDLPATQMTQDMLLHAETQLQSTGLRLKSIEKRMNNVIALSFHLVTQDGNRIMQADSNSMATIALVTLIFLPMSVVSTVFGGQFFDFGPEMLSVSRSFWVFWVISIPLTLLVLGFWRLSNRNDWPGFINYIRSLGNRP